MGSSTLTTATTAVAAENALSTTIDGETVILHRDVGKYYGLNEVGTFVWELLQEPRSIEELCQEVVEVRTTWNANGVEMTSRTCSWISQRRTSFDSPKRNRTDGTD